HHADGHWADSDTGFELAASQRAGHSSSAAASRAFELAAARGIVRASSVNSADLRRSELAASQRAGRSSSAAASRAFELAALQRLARSASVDLRRSTLATSNQRRQASWSAIPLKLKSLLSQRVLGNGFRKKLKALHPRRVFRIRQVSTTTCR